MNDRSKKPKIFRITGSVLLSAIPAAAALAQNSTATPTAPAGPSQSMVRTPIANATPGGSVIVPPQTDGHMNLPAPPDVATSPDPPQNTTHPPDAAGPPGNATGN